MPTYEYACDKCGGEFEYFQGIKEEPKSVCEKCGGHLTKLLSAGTGLIFKGSGFYITDYKGKSGGESTGSSDSKPADAKPAGNSKASPAKTESAPKPATPSKSE